MFREFHLKDLPTNKLKIRIEDKFRYNIFNTFKKETGNSSKILKSLGFNFNFKNIWTWKFGRHSIPLDSILKILELLFNRGHEEFTQENLEKKIIYIKSKQGQDKYAILNPKLPLIEDERLVKIVAHIIGDGYGGFYDKKMKCIKRANYYNSNKEVFNKFIECLSVFGNVRYSLQNNKMIYIPTSVIYILNHIYQIDFHSEKAKVPSYFFNLDKNLLNHFLATFIDDEGSLTENSCRIVLKNETLIRELNFLFDKIGFKTSDIKVSYGKYWYLTIHDVNKIKELPMVHSEKLNLIKFSLGRRKTKQNKGRTKNEIVNLLREHSYNSVELSSVLGISSQSIRSHMRQLLKANKVNYKIIKGTKYWTLGDA